MIIVLHVDAVVAWVHSDVLLLIDSYRQHTHNFSNPTLRRGEVWNMIAQGMNAVKGTEIFTGIVCSKKFSNLELRFKEKKDKMGKTGRGRGRWIYFDLMDEIMGNRGTVKPISSTQKPVTSSSSSAASSSSTVSSCASLAKSLCVSSVISATSAPSTSSISASLPTPTSSLSQLISPPSDSSDAEECDMEATKSVSAGVKRKNNTGRGSTDFKQWAEKLSSDMNKWHERMDKRMRNFENIEKERVGVLTEMKDIMKGWVDCMTNRRET